MIVNRDRVIPITIVPNSSYYARGLVNLRGNIVQVIDLKKYLDLKSELEEKNIIVLKIRNEVLGILVDDVEEVIEVLKELIEKHNNSSIIHFKDGIAAIIENKLFEDIMHV